MRSAGLLAASLLCLASTAAFGASDLGQIKREYETTKRIVDGDDAKSRRYGFSDSISDSPRAVSALENEWQIVSNWVLASAGTSPEPKELAKSLKRLDPGYDASSLMLDRGLYLVAAERGGTGTFFVIRKDGDKWREIWNARQATSSSLAAPISAWSAVGATSSCRVRKPDAAWDQCGPIAAGELGVLPRDGSGHIRFYVDAWYAQFAGETNSFQLSVWTWAGARATPDFAKSYMQMIEVPHPPQIDGNLLRIATKEEFQNFFSCGACVGRQTVWSLRIAPTAIQDLGTKSLMPEVDAIDDLVGRIAHDRPTSDLAAPAVVKALEPLVASQRDDSHKIDPKWFSLGMIGNGAAEMDPANPDESLVCFSTDADGDRRIFTLEHRGSRFYISKMRDIRARDTPDKLCSKPNE